MSEFGIASEKPVLVIGAAGLDVVGRLQTELKNVTSNPARIRTSFGGVARNVAETLSRLGQPVRLLSVIGKDQIGDEVLAYTRDAGVNVSSIFRTDTFPTGFYMGILDMRGKLKFAIDDMRILSELNESYLAYNADLFEEASLVFVDANLPEASLSLVFELAKKYNIPICADPTTSALAPRIAPYLNQLHFLAPNSAEAAILNDQPFDPSDQPAAIDAARRIVNKGVDVAVIGLAEYGVCYATSDTSGHIPAVRTKITDPTGAGDALTAAIIFGMLNDIELDDAVRLGASAASLTLRHPGTVLPTLTLQMLYDELGL